MLCGILFVLHTGIQWEYLPQELGFESGMTCWRRLRDWNEAGVWQQLHEVLLAELNAAAREGAVGGLDARTSRPESWQVQRGTVGGLFQMPIRTWIRLPTSSRCTW